ncbi:cytochrome c [Mucilaginibacter sp. BT774]|uniref:c-type cytochrome n=1 Tax=Mucilaginibacter sp. BT774 TaxID=3062276 RepID=UPI00267619C4|nr:cytochrome c [Mucilaginibacter sp. BT774]MDO3625678.1 cytochrome c [Mucilaginibacter sp. BT774]
MKKIKIHNKTWAIIAIFSTFIAIVITGCVESQKVASKGGAQLWAENCQRCHNTPSPASFSHEQWVTIGLHMQTRAQLTAKERDKIIAFLSQ